MGAKNNNTDVTKALRDGMKINQAIDLVPQEIAEKILPVFIANPKRILDVCEGANKASTGGTTLYTVPENKDFFLTNISLQVIQDVVCDVATGGIDVSGVIGGVKKIIIELPTVTLTPNTLGATHNFKYPLKLDRNTSITSTVNYTAGVMVRAISFQGYIVEN